MAEEQRLHALRGAVCCRNDAEEIRERVAELYDELLRLNALAEGDIVSLIFSVTVDLTAVNPAAALRKSGRAAELALFSVQESAADGSPAGIVRVLVHCYLEAGRAPAHVYIRGAEALRPDRAKNPGKTY
jgi:chorismate mutase